MDAKISITTDCNAKCKTCPVWEYPGEHMGVAEFKLMWTKLMLAPEVTRVLLNNTGDMFIHPHRKEIFEYIRAHHYKPVIMTTNAAAMDCVPPVDVLIISFNGGSKEDYEYTTGLPFKKTMERIKRFYPDMEGVHCEIHCLAWDGNKGCEDALKALWEDFPGRVRVSYKYDNQMQEDHTIEEYRKDKRIPCDYLGMLSIMPNGQIVSCAHDFQGVTNYGNIFTDRIKDLLENRMRKQKRIEHYEGRYTGLCEKCNYNTGIEGRIVYLK